MSHDAVQIIRFWQAVEVFSPQSVPNHNPRGNTWDMRPGKPLPWEAGFRLPPPAPRMEWRHDVYCGVYDLSGVRDALVDVYGQDRPEHDFARGESALFACRVDQRGRLIEGTTGVSVCAWAVGRIGRGESPLGDFQTETGQHAAAIARAASISAGVKLLAKAVRDTVPDSAASAAGSAVTAALTPFGGPVAAAGGALASGVTKTVVGAVTEHLGKHGDSGEAASSGEQDEPQKADGTATDDLAEEAQTALTEKDLRAFSTGLADRLGVQKILRPGGVRIHSYQVRADSETDATPPFLNSFLADDLKLAEAALRTGTAGTALTSYLTATEQIDTAARVDVREQPRTALDGCRPDRFPAGRWVSDTGRPLAFSQQFAVNQIMHTLGNGQPGLFSVNGPPGTGKTTMLRDVVAAIIVQRAEALADLRSASDAFTGPRLHWSTADRTYTIVPLNPALTGHEIVVASSNNGAVQNVTAEIPGPSGIARHWQQAADDLDYFRTTAAHVTGEGAWALMAGVLGNAENRKAFVRDFWWGGEYGKRRGDGLFDILKVQGGAPGWRAAQSRFRECRARVQALSSERITVARQLDAYPAVAAERDRAAGSLSEASARLAEAQGRRPPLASAFDEADQLRRTAGETLRAHEVRRPGWWRLLTPGGWHERAEWKATLRRLADAAVSAGDASEASRRNLAALDEEIATRAEEEAKVRSEYEVADRRARKCARLIADARRRWPEHVPDGPEYNEVNQRNLIGQRELSAPWADEEYATARTELFLAALALHKAFVLAQANRIQQNLNALVKAMGGGGRPEPAALLAAWQTLFLVVPVVSSTFASFGRLFGGLGPESLGWLLIDEAGQATPQSAAGALLRSRRAVIVGDPLQIEPVVTLPWDGQQALLREFGVAEEWAPKRTSVQQVADRLAPAGTWLDGPSGDPVWVGAPLRVHRRCDWPMFEASNRIAYDGMMVFGTPERSKFHGSSIWFDVRSDASEGHWIPEEGEALGEILRGLRRGGIPAADIRVLSPFRNVATRAASIHASIFKEVSASDRDDWIGTVHRMQGKEADVVILVLGGDPGKPGSRKFAVESPNLLNVAVTRARRRLYVIGDRGTWGDERFFSTLTDETLLRHYVPPS